MFANFVVVHFYKEHGIYFLQLMCKIPLSWDIRHSFKEKASVNMNQLKQRMSNWDTFYFCLPWCADILALHARGYTFSQILSEEDVPTLRTEEGSVKLTLAPARESGSVFPLFLSFLCCLCLRGGYTAHYGQKKVLSNKCALTRVWFCLSSLSLFLSLICCLCLRGGYTVHYGQKKVLSNKCTLTRVWVCHPLCTSLSFFLSLSLSLSLSSSSIFLTW